MPSSVAIRSAYSAADPAPSMARSTAGMARCKWCTADVPDYGLERHLETICPMVPIQCAQRDTELMEEECTMEVRGREMFREHRAKCPFQPVPCVNAPRCQALVSKRSMKIHMQICPFQKIVCAGCGARFYRADQDYHSSSCPEAQVECPLNCGKVLKRCELVPHFNDTLMDHSYVNLQSEVYLPPDHPAMVYATLLKKIKELKMQLELQRNPNILREPDGVGSIAGPASVLNYSGLPPLTNTPMPPAAASIRSGAPTSLGGSQLPADHLQRYDACLSRVSQLTSGVNQALQTLRMTSTNPSSETKEEMAATKTVLVQAREALMPEVDHVQHEMDDLSTYVDPNGRSPPQAAVNELISNRTQLGTACRAMDASFADLDAALLERRWIL